MTAGQSMLPEEARLGSPFAERPASRWDRIDEFLGKASEYLNPILVKETRQALKSKQFLITFTLTLILGWGWSLLGTVVAFEGYGWGIFYAPFGAQMLTGYYWVLSFPLLVIVPFTAFRSLSVEREDGTHELIAITSLKPHQIVGGKLGSAVLQILLYLSALTPCMAFTYMLRGIDLFIIFIVIGHVFLASVFLSIVGLCFGTVTTARHWQSVLGVIFILILVMVFIIGLIMATNMIPFQPPYQEPAFWPLNFFIATILIGYGGLFFLAAMARITFDSDNKSTKLRIGMIAMQVAAIGWAVWGWLVFEEEVFLLILAGWSAFHWWLMGSLMVGESADVSPRVRRTLPATFLGRSFLSWLYPGPGSGLMLASLSMAGVTLLVTALHLAIPLQTMAFGVSAFLAAVPPGIKLLISAILLILTLLAGLSFYAVGRQQATFIVSLFGASLLGIFLTLTMIALPVPQVIRMDIEVVQITACMMCYVILYVGLTRLIMLVGQNVLKGSIFLSLLIGILLLAVGIIVPFCIAIGYANAYRGYGGPPDFLITIMLPCPPAAFMAYDGGVDFTELPWFGGEIPLEPFVLVVLAGGMLLLNMLLTAREVDRQREAPPDRVLQDEAARKPAQEKPAASPWDEEEEHKPDAQARE